MKSSESTASPPVAQLYEFGGYVLDPVRRRLRQLDGTSVSLPPRVFDTLLFLVEHHGSVADKERLMAAVWPDSLVEDNNLSQSISSLRHLFGERPGAHRFIVTVPGRGYRFVADVKTRQANGQFADGSEAQAPIAPAPAEALISPAPGEISTSSQPRRFLPIAFAGVIVVALATVLLLIRVRTKQAVIPLTSVATASAALPEKSIAVLPFDNLSSDTQNGYFVAGVQDEILTSLSRVADLKVISRTSVMQYKGTAKRNLRDIAQQLGVAHVLEGSVQRSANRVRVNAQLIDARNDAHLWAQTYDGDLANVFAIQSDIAKAIAEQLQAKLSAGEKAAIAQPPTTDLAANALYVQAKQLESGSSDTTQSLPQAARLLDEAVARDPHFLLAYCLLARVHLAIYFGGVDHTPGRRELANAAVQAAARLEPNAGEVHLALAYYAYQGFRDYDRARAELELARATLPNDSVIYALSGAIDRRQARWTESMRNWDRAVELDPRNIFFLMNTAFTYQGLHRIAEADRLFARVIALAPRNYDARRLRSELAFAERAEIRPLRAELSKILNEEPQAAKEIAEALFDCALLERDPAAANRALAVIPPEGIATEANFSFPREWFVGIAAHTFDDTATAHTAFTAARGIMEKLLREQPDYAPAWSLLGRIDAALGRKEDAIREGRRACELLPVSKDAWIGPAYVINLAVIYAWVGENELALEQLGASAQTPNGVPAYGDLKLSPRWDRLRGDPRFEKIVASLAPGK